MTKLISVVVVLLLLLGGWQLFKYWEKLDAKHAVEQKEAAARTVSPDQLPGMPYQLQPSLNAAERQGPAALQNWLKTYGPYLHDPRLAWIELDYCVMISRDNPREARRIFAAVKERTPTTSPVWHRIQQLTSSYQ